MVHFYIAVNEGLKQIDPGALEYVESDGKRMCQRLAKRHQIEPVLFAPGGKGVKSSPYNNPAFRHYCARINSAFDGPRREFPSRSILNGVDLSGANLSGANLDDALLNSANLSGARFHGTNLFGANLSHANLNNADLFCARLDGANLSGASLKNARLNGAHLRTAIGLTREQIESAWINEATILPKEFEKIKPEILERQRLRREQLEEISTSLPAPEVVAPEKKEDE